jgi:nickel-dependent lactate racemase
MDVLLAYGERGLAVEIDQRIDCTLIVPRGERGLDEEAARAELGRALRAPIGAPPLRELGARARRAAVVFSDLTRPMPNRLVLPVVLEELGLPPERVVLLNALGTHRPNTKAELDAMLGEQLTSRYRVAQNDAFDRRTQRCVGRSRRGHELWLDAELLDCDLRVLTGFIEPHLFAGFSGGGKAILPGMAGLETILRNHDAEMIGHPRATWCVADDNPIFEEIEETARAVGGTFLCNVALDGERRVAGVFAGELSRAHRAGCELVRRRAVVPISAPFDVVLTTGGGFPADINLYQAVKGLSAAARAVRPGGVILLAAECRDGLPDHGRYGALLRESASPRALLDRILAPGFLEQDQWEAQIHAQVLLRAAVRVRSEGLAPAQIAAAHLEPCASLEAALAELAAASASPLRLAVMPLGPQAVPLLAPAGAVD